MKRFTLTVTDNTTKEPVMTVQVDEHACGNEGKGEGSWLRAGKVPFTQQVFKIEQKFAAGFDPNRVPTAVVEGVAPITRHTVSWTDAQERDHSVKQGVGEALDEFFEWVFSSGSVPRRFKLDGVYGTLERGTFHRKLAFFPT